MATPGRLGADGEGNLPAMRSLLRRGPDASATGPGALPGPAAPRLSNAAADGRDLLSGLLALGVAGDAPGDAGAAEACRACQNAGDLLAQPPDGAGTDRDRAHHLGRTPLLAALESQHLACVDALLRAGRDVNRANGQGWTPLHAACAGGHLAQTEALLRAGAALDRLDQDGRSPLHAACRGGHLGCVEALLAAGADVGLSSGGSTPLLIACACAQRACVEALLRAGADANPTDRAGRSPLYVVCCGGYADCLEALLRAGADVNAVSSGGYTALHAACAGGFVAGVEALLRAGAASGRRAEVEVEVETPLDAASQGGHEAVVRMLLRHCPPPTPDELATAAGLALVEGHFAITSLLRRAGADMGRAAADVEPAVLDEYERYRRPRLAERYAFLGVVQRRRAAGSVDAAGSKQPRGVPVGLTRYLAREVGEFL